MDTAVCVKVFNIGSPVQYATGYVDALVEQYEKLWLI